MKNKFFSQVLISFVCGLNAILSNAQTQFSENGFILTPKGTIRILIVYASVDNNGVNCTPYGDDLQWPQGQAPKWAEGDAGLNMPRLFDYDFTNPAAITPGSLTDYYYQASCGNLIVLSDYINLVFSCTDPLLDNGDRAAIVMNWFNHQTTQITTANGKQLDYFNLWNDPGPGIAKNTAVASGDTRIDAMFIIWKNHPTMPAGSCHAGFGLNGGYSNYNFTAPYSSAQQNDITGMRYLSDWYGCDYDGTLYTFTAEFLHSLFGGNNWHTSGGADAWTFYHYPRAYCTTEQYDGMTNMWCGFDRNHLGWKYPSKQFLISGIDPTTNTEKNGDLDWQNQTAPDEYIIRDFSKSGDMLRIKLPHFDWQQTGDVKNQYLWIENHQMISEFDKWHFDFFPEHEQMTPGLYMSVQVGKDHKLSNDALNEDIFNGDDTNTDIVTDPNSHPNRCGSWMMPIPAEGFYDFNYRTDLIGQGCGNDSYIPVDKTQSIPNPLTGFSDQYNVYDNGTNNNLSADKDPNRSFVENGIVKCAGQGYGDSRDAFTLGGNNKISISTNPSSTPVYTEISAGYISGQWENRKIHLNGLSVEIIGEQNNYTWGLNMNSDVPKDLKLKIRWDDYKLTNDVRWCGDIVLHPSVHFDAANLPLDDISERSLDIQPNITLLLDRGKSPTQHVSYEQIKGEHIFTKPTYFTATENSYIYQAFGSTIHIDNKSTLHLEGGSKLEMDNGSQLLVTNGSTLIIDDNALLQMHEAYLYIDESSTLIIRNSNPDAGLVLGDLVSTPTNALIEIYGTLRYENGAPMVYKGSGRYEFIGAEAAVIFDDPVNSYVEFTGPYFAFPALTLRDGAQITMNTAIISLSSLLIEVHQHATLNLADAENIMIQDVHMNGYEISDANHTALNIENVWNLEMGACRFNQDALASMQNALKISGIPQTSVFALYDIRIDRSVNPLALSDGDYMKCSNLFINLLGNPQSDNLITLKKITKSMIKESVLKYGNTGINISGFNNALNNILYLDKTDITDTHTGIDSKGSQLFLRNGSSIKSVVNGIVAEGNVLYDGDNNPITYNSMITLGDIGCANILQFTNYGIWATNTLLNMDANLHAIANQSNPVPNSLVRASAGTGAFIKLCYPNKNPLASIIPTTIYASGNYWGGITPIAPGGNQAPDFDVRKYGNHACVGLNYNIIPVLTDPLTTCSVIHNDCESCEPVTNDDEGASQNVLIGNAYKMLYGNFTPLDTTYTRNPFEEISVLRLALDTLTNIWTVYDLENNPYTISDRSVHRILTSRVLLPVTNTANARKHIRNIFEHFNISDTDADHLFSLYPNPANQTIHLASSYSGNIKVSLYDIQGRVIFNSEFEEYINSYPINIEGLTDGIYCVRIIDCKQQLIDKLTFIKAH